jgi:hypothetical protein
MCALLLSPMPALPLPMVTATTNVEHAPLAKALALR